MVTDAAGKKNSVPRENASVKVKAIRDEIGQQAQSLLFPLRPPYVFRCRRPDFLDTIVGGEGASAIGVGAFVR